MVLPLLSSPPTPLIRRKKNQNGRKKAALDIETSACERASVVLPKHQPFIPFYCFISLQTFFFLVYLSCVRMMNNSVIRSAQSCVLSTTENFTL